MRRISNPNVKVWLPCVLVTLSTKSMLASARTQGKLAEYPTSGLVNAPILIPTRPLSNWLILMPGIPRAVESFVP